MKKVKFINYKSDYTYSPPIQHCLINMADVVMVTPESAADHRVSGPLVTVTFRSGEKLICVGEVDDFFTEETTDGH